MKVQLAALVLSGTTLFAAPQQVPPASTDVIPQADIQFAADVLRTAAAFNTMVKSMNLPQTFHPGATPTDQNGHPMNRDAAVIGAGAGIGAAVGAMSGKQRGALIGAAAGAAGALIVEEILKHQPVNADKASSLPRFAKGALRKNSFSSVRIQARALRFRKRTSRPLEPDFVGERLISVDEAVALRAKDVGHLRVYGYNRDLSCAAVSCA